jgi:MoaE-MoaD fusion protein
MDRCAGVTGASVTGGGVSEMVVHVRLFAVLRERAGTDSLELTLRRGATVADAIRALAEHEQLGELLERVPVHMAVNRDYAAAGTVLTPEDELALIPPVSGGADAEDERGVTPRVHVRISEEPLSLQALSRAVGDPGSGAIVIFQGVTREVERLDYEAYVAMAQERIEAIVRECIAAHDLRAAAVEHRVGSVPRGEPSVIVAVSAAHRGEAFAGAREAIDRLKAEAPIWKREHATGAPGRWATGSEPAR